MLQGNIGCSDLATALTRARSAAKLATSLGTVPRATAEVEEAVTEVVDMVEDTEEVVQAVEEVEVCSLLSQWLPRSLSALCTFDADFPLCFRSNLLLLRRLWPHVPRLHPRPEMLQLYVKLTLAVTQGSD